MSDDKKDNDKLFRLEQRLDDHEKNDIERFDKLIEAQRINTSAIAELTTSINSVVEGTSAIIQLHRDFQGTVRVGESVQKFLLWCLKWGLIGTAVVSSANWLIDKFNN